MPSPVLARRLITPFRSKLLAEYAVNGFFGRVTTSRATVSPAFNNASGNLEQAGAGEIALVGGDSVACWPGITNLVTRSTDPATYWTTRGSSTITGGQTGPDGGSTAGLFENVGAISTNDVYRLTTGGAADVRAEPSFYIKQVSPTGTLSMVQAYGGSSLGLWSIDLSLLGGGWERITRNHNAVTITNEFINDGSGRTGLQLYTASGTVDFYADAFQIEETEYSAPYVPTAGSSVAVDASEPKYAEVSGLTNNLAGRLYWTPLADDQGTVWILGNYTDANNGWGILHDGTNLIFRNRVSGTNNDATIALNYVVDTEYRIDYRLAQNGLDIAVDGTKGTTDSTTTDLTNATNSYYGQDGNDSGHCLCTIREHTEKRIASNFSDAEWLA